jgi:membrane-bound hydrogenase subunit beta
MEILSPEEIVESFKAALGSAFIDSKIYQREVAVKKNIFTSIWIYVKRGAFRKAVEHICELQKYPHLAIISSSDRGDSLELIYHFTIYYGRHLKELSLGLCVNLPKNDPKIPTITDIIPGALFTERETQEMMGVEVVGIPDSRRLFLPDDFPEGVYPWRRDETGPEDMLRVLPGRQQKWQQVKK